MTGARFVLSAILLAVTVGCGEAGSMLEKARAEGRLVVAYANEEPFGYLDPEKNRVTGEAPEIARVVAAKLGIGKVEPVLTEWKSLIPGLKAGRFDCIAAGMYITPERAENVIFSDPTYRIGEAFLVKAGNPKKLHAFEDVAKHPDAKLGFVRGTVERKYAAKTGIPEDRTVVFPDNDSAVAGLRAGRVDAFVGTALTVQTYVRKLGEDAGVERADPFRQPVIDGKPLDGSFGAFAFRPGDTELRDAFNEVLRSYLGTEEHRALVAPFGFTETELPGGMTAEQVLQRAAPRSP